MLTPTFRFLALPLAAVAALAVLSMSPASSKMEREASPSVRAEVTDCTALRPGEMCVVAHAGS